MYRNHCANTILHVHHILHFYSVQSKSRHSLSGRNMRFHYVVSHLFLLLTHGLTAGGLHSCRLNEKPNHTGASGGQVQYYTSMEDWSVPEWYRWSTVLNTHCQSCIPRSYSFMLHSHPPAHTHKIPFISRRHNSVNISYWQDAAW